MVIAKATVRPLLDQKWFDYYRKALILSSVPVRTHSSNPEMIPAWIRDQLFVSCKRSNQSIEKVKTFSKDPKLDSEHMIPSNQSEFIHGNGLIKGVEQGESNKNRNWTDRFALPAIRGKSMPLFFNSLADKQVTVYIKLLESLIISLPSKPQHWMFQSGWTCYREGFPPVRIQYPCEDALILDVEVCTKESFAPIIATAVAPGAWYCWVSPSLVENSNADHKHVQLKDLVPLGNDGEKERIVVGHYVAYDMVRVKESYHVNMTGLRSFDTMAAHISISGVTNLQKFKVASSSAKMPWAKLASGNSLSQLYHLYCGKYLDKAKRDIFINGSSADVREHFQELVTYCSKDVVATHSVFCKLLPLFLERFSHPVTLAAMLDMSSMYMPISGDWPQSLCNVKEKISEVDREIGFLLQQLAQETCELLHNQKYLEDPWMWDQNWTVKSVRNALKTQSMKNAVQQGAMSKISFQAMDSNNHENAIPHKTPMCEYPEWFRKIAIRDNFGSPLNQELYLTFGMNITPKLLRLCWGQYPLHYLRGHGWGMLVPVSDPSREPKTVLVDSVPVKSILKMCADLFNKGTTTYCLDPTDFRDNIESYNSNIFEERWNFTESPTEIQLNAHILFRKLPHSQGIGKNVGSPFSKELMNNPALCSLDPRGQRILCLLRRKQFWNKYGDKLESLPIVWFDEDLKRGAVIPATVVTGDFTRHVREEPLSALYFERKDSLGTEMCRAMMAPSGWLFLSARIPEADVWMASLLSDSISGRYGGTALGQRILSDSYYASVSDFMGVPEEQAKSLTRAVLYGAKRGFIARMLRSVDPSISKWLAMGRADRLLKHLLGQCTPQPDFQTWHGGVQSELWSKLAMAASKHQVATPILGGRLSRVLESDPSKFASLTMNWIIQSSTVDFLHLLLTCFHDLAPYARCSLISSSGTPITCFLVPEIKQYHAAKSLHIAFLYAKAFCVSQVGLSDLPVSSAFLPHVLLSRSLQDTELYDSQKLNFFQALQLSEHYTLLKN